MWLYLRTPSADAVAPEVKKGVKMTVHHSRNTAMKQVCYIFNDYSIVLWFHSGLKLMLLHLRDWDD